jgi:hypothetical protein
MLIHLTRVVLKKTMFFHIGNPAFPDIERRFPRITQPSPDIGKSFPNITKSFPNLVKTSETLQNHFPILSCHFPNLTCRSVILRGHNLVLRNHFPNLCTPPQYCAAISQYWEMAGQYHEIGPLWQKPLASLGTFSAC